MKKFNELKKNDIIKVEDYIFKITGYNEEYKSYYIEGKKINDNDSNSTYIMFLTTEEEYNKYDKWSKLHFIPFNEVSEVIR